MKNEDRTSGMQRRSFLKGTVAALAATGLEPAGGLSAIVVPLADEDRRGPRAPTPFPYVDGLSFVGADATEIARSGLSAFIWDVSAGQQVRREDGSAVFQRTFEACARSITAARRRLAADALPGAFLATRGSEIGGAHRAGRTAVYFQFQGAEPIGEQLDRLELFYELGLRVLQITHHHDNPWGGGAIEAQPTGLTAVGREGVERLDALRIIPDLAHASDRTALDVLRVSRRPVIVSHGAARALVPNARCTPDEVIRGVAESGGVIGIFMMSFWLTMEPHATPAAFIRQIRHVVNVAGIDAAAVANDYTISGELSAAAADNDNDVAVRNYFPWWDSVAARGVMGFEERPRHVVIPEFNNVRRMFHIHEALDRAGFRSSEVEKIMGGNWVRVLTDALG